jgi:hypothetical protein
MSDPIRFLVSFGQAVSTMALYNDGHPARERASIVPTSVCAT